MLIRPPAEARKTLMIVRRIVVGIALADRRAGWPVCAIDTGRGLG
jgi:hypothetical protein